MPKPSPSSTREAGLATGRDLRRRCPRSAHATWPAETDSDRADPIALLEASNRSRLADLVPVRNERMAESPFTFFRGAPMVMASDLSRTPSTGVHIQICGDAHLLNFGTYATPERNLIFDINDFDETHVGPWEWDLKRLAASLVVAARTAGHADAVGTDAVGRAMSDYRSTMATVASLSPFEVWHARVDADAIVARAPTKQSHAEVENLLTKARRRTSLAALSKLTTISGERRVIVEDPPLVTRVTGEELDLARGFASAYRRTLDADRRLLLGRYEFVDAARKVVGVGSVGTRCYVVLLAAPVDLDPLFLQIKEAQPSVIAPYVRTSHHRNQGQRVVTGQRIMQAASDVFLGWGRSGGFDAYVRQLRDMKGSVPVGTAPPSALADYAALCGATLAHAHARAGEPRMLTGYLGDGPVFDTALIRFAVAYADQTERDYEAFVRAFSAGRLDPPGG